MLSNIKSVNLGFIKRLVETSLHFVHSYPVPKELGMQPHFLTNF